MAILKNIILILLGIGGGTVIAQGTPEEVAECGQSYTGAYVKKMLER